MRSKQYKDLHLYKMNIKRNNNSNYNTRKQ